MYVYIYIRNEKERKEEGKEEKGGEREK